MKKKGFVFISAILLVFLVGCGQQEFTDVKLDILEIDVSSESITADGKLLTICGADKAPNDPLGENQSPQLSWKAVEGTESYVILMVDETASWLHWCAKAETSVEQGAFTNKEYVGPYPPKGSGVHDYRMEVLALKELSEAALENVDKQVNYKELIEQLDTVNSKTGNILARGHVTAAFEHGDNNQ